MKSSTISAFAAVIGGLGLIIGLMVPALIESNAIEIMLMIWVVSGAVALSLAICASIIKHLERLTRAAEIVIATMELPKTADGACPRCGSLRFTAAGNRCMLCMQKIAVETDE